MSEQHPNDSSFFFAGRNWATLSTAVGTKSISQIKNFYYDYKKQSGKLNVKADKKGIVNQAENTASKSKTNEIVPNADKNQNAESMIGESDRAPLPTSDLTQNSIANPNPQSLTPPTHVASSTQSHAADVRNLLEQRQQELLLLQHQQELSEHNARQEAMAREVESQAAPSRNATSPVPGTGIAENLRNNEMIQQLLKQHTQNQQLELQLRQQELHQQRQQQQHHHPPQSALHQILARHQREQHSHDDGHRRIEHHPQQTVSNLLSAWPPASQLVHSQNAIHHAQYAAALQQEGGGTGSHESASNTDSQPDIINIQRLLQLRQLQQNPAMLALSQSNHGNPLSSLMGLASSAGSGLPAGPAGLLAQLESLNSANRKTSQADQQASDLSAMINAQSLLGYSNIAGNRGPNLRGMSANPLFHHNNGGGANPAAADGSRSPRNLPDAMALLHAMQSRDNGKSQHGFGGPDRQA